jgi:glycosyltransferase involved in cell wall biosynthesis
MNHETISLSIFFPAYNEEANIRGSVAAAEAVVRKITPTYEIIIVDDGSKDATGAIADELARDNEHIKVVHHHPNKGYGAALWSGIQAAQYDYVFFTDADLQFDLSELAILTHFVPQYQVVLGYRAPRRDNGLRILNASLWNFLNRLLFGLNVKDIDCAFKLIDRKLAASLPIKTRGAMMSAEMLIRLQYQHIPFKEVPVSHFARTEGIATGANPAVILRAFKELFKLYKSRLGFVPRQQLVRFSMVGVINTLVDLSAYIYILNSYAFFASHLLLAKGFSFLLGTVSSFLLNRYWTFHKTTRLTITEIVRFYLTVAGGLILDLLSLSFFLSIIHMNAVIAAFFATLIAFIWNFLLSKLWVYSETMPIHSLTHKRF